MRLDSLGFEIVAWRNVNYRVHPDHQETRSVERFMNA